MNRPIHLAVALVGLAVLALLLGSPPGRVAAIPPLPTPTPEFSATLSLTPARRVVPVGQALRLTVDLAVAGCNYPIMDLTVKEDATGQPLFSHLEPPKDVIGPPVDFPSQWTFRAERPGRARFTAQTFGETDCNGWQWHYENATSPEVEVLALPQRIYIPAASG